MASDLTRDQLLPPGGVFQDLVGAPLTSVVVAPTHMVHQVATTAAITTITPPREGFSGPIFLVAASVFSWTTSGNIAAAPGTTLVANRAHGFVYEPRATKWYPIGQIV